MSYSHLGSLSFGLWLVLRGSELRRDFSKVDGLTPTVIPELSVLIFVIELLLLSVAIIYGVK